MQTKGHSESHGGLRGHSIGPLYPFMVIGLGMSDWAVQHPNGAISKKYKEIDKAYLGFLYMPFMHSESLKVHECALELFKQEGLEVSYQYELKHKVIIDRFGRYPHRNHILGRDSTPEEIIFLTKPNSSF